MEICQLRNLVTGGAGFIGSHLCRTLLDEGEEVVCVDNLTSGRLDTVKGLSRYVNFTFIEADVLVPLEIKVERIYNLACPASPKFYQADPIQTMKTNVIGMINILELAASQGARVLQASTSEVYGDPLEHPQKENYWGNVNPIGVRSCYDEGKRAAESLCFDYMRQLDVEIKVVRIFNTYGPNMRADDGRVICNFINQALKSQPLTIYGSGLQTRSFCYVEDLVHGLIRVMDSPSHLMGPFNLGNPQEFTILELTEVLSSLFGKQLAIEFHPLPLNDPRQRNPDITFVKETLGWEPSTELIDGLGRTISYFSKDLV